MGFIGSEASTDYARIFASTDRRGLVFHGPARPQIYGSLRNTFRYRSLSLSVNIAYELKYFFKDPHALGYSALANDWNLDGYDKYLNRWKQPGDELVTSVPSFVYPLNTRRDNFYTASSVNVHPGDHIRLRDIALDWIVPGERLNRKGITVALKGYVNNLGIIWKQTNLKVDPAYGIPPPIDFGIGAMISL
ncbi:hypothetical protein MKQ70_05575 [Chitinophaga sedimenti]|uniref:hypothetical protein n=1 Tax=Chitinophaga sedimenti TaxID=2033606 RepID=UPI0020057A72|nr:hypothetical protein [Chitinophaga sedimenti]MCK7554502.1 hypothetical protein [Chitinophaga sedimenti]